MQQQLCLIPKPKLTFGGSLGNSKREARVLSNKRPIHLVLKSQKTVALRKRKTLVDGLIRKQAKSFGIKIYKMSVQFDHVHILMLIPNRKAYMKFIRAVTGLLARQIKKGLWLLIPFTRILNWGRDYKGGLAYVYQNEMEILGIWRYRPRKRRNLQM